MPDGADLLSPRKVCNSSKDHIAELRRLDEGGDLLLPTLSKSILTLAVKPSHLFAPPTLISDVVSNQPVMLDLALSQLFLGLLRVEVDPAPVPA